MLPYDTHERSLAQSSEWTERRPDQMQYFEDLTEGRVIALGARQITLEEIIDFAQQYDPQSFHVDEDAARSSAFGGLIASGIHTLGFYMRHFVDGLLSDSTSLGSPGLDEVRWPCPVRPGDVLECTYRVQSARLSRSQPDRGIVHGLGEAVNQDGVTVMSLKVVNLFGTRPGS